MRKKTAKQIMIDWINEWIDTERSIASTTSVIDKFLLEMYARWLKDFIKVEYGKNVEDYDWSNIK